MRERRGLGRLGAALLAALGLTAAAAAQTAAPDLNHLALEWARGDFRSPLVGEIDGTPRLRLRRVTMPPRPPPLERPARPRRRRPPPRPRAAGAASGAGWSAGGGAPTGRPIRARRAGCTFAAAAPS